MKNAVSGLIVVLMFIGGAFLAFKVFTGEFEFGGRSSGPPSGAVNVPVRLGAFEKAQMEIELGLVEAEFEAKKVGKRMRPENRKIKIDKIDK